MEGKSAAMRTTGFGDLGVEFRVCGLRFDVFCVCFFLFLGRRGGGWVGWVEVRGLSTQRAPLLWCPARAAWRQGLGFGSSLGLGPCLQIVTTRILVHLRVKGTLQH